MKKILAMTLLALGVSSVAMADDLLTTIQGESAFKTFSEALKTTGLEESLKADGPFTLFVPNDEAFAKLPKAKLKKLLANKEELTKVVQYHIVAAKITKADVDAGKVATVEGDDLALSITDGVKVNNAVVKGTEIHADNGTIHIVDAVLIPKKAKKL